MPTVMDILAGKGSKIHSVGPQATVLEATRKMNAEKIGAMVIMDGSKVAGMFTERDVLRRVVAEERAPSETLVSEVMTSNVICVPPDTDIDEAGEIFLKKKIRHLPVCDAEGQLIGMISIGDLNAYHQTHQEQTIHFLNDYIYGRA